MENKKCTYNDIFIEQFIDNQLSYEESAEIAAHIKICEPCRQLYNELKTIKSLISSIARTESLSEMERRGFEKLIDEIDDTSIFIRIKNSFTELFSSNRFIVISASGAFSVFLFLFIYNISILDKDNRILMKEIVTMHEQNLPDEFTEKDNIENIVHSNLKINPDLSKIVKHFPNIRGRFSHIGSVPVASFKLKNKGGNGTLLLSRADQNLKEILAKHTKCVKETNCKAYGETLDDKELLHWSRNNSNYIFVADNPKIKSDMVQLISAEY